MSYARFGQIIMGPAGSGKTTYTAMMKEYFAIRKKTVRIVNLDPAAEDPLAYGEPDIDIRDLISLDDVQEALDYGPNGGLMYAMEYLVQNSEFLTDAIDSQFGDDEYFLFDCPGQIELYVHNPIMRQLTQQLERNLNIRLCGVFCIDSTFIRDAAKFISASMMTLSAMAHLELPHINILTKADLIIADKDDGEENDANEEDGFAGDDALGAATAELMKAKKAKRMAATGKSKHLQPFGDFGHSLNIANSKVNNASNGRFDNPGDDVVMMRGDVQTDREEQIDLLSTFLDNEVTDLLPMLDQNMHPKYKKLNRAFVDLLDEFKIVSYCYLNPHDEDTIDTIVLRINDTIQFYESQEVDDKKMDRLEAIQEEMDAHADEMAQEGGDMDYNERMQNMMEQHFDDGALGGDLDLGS